MGMTYQEILEGKVVTAFPRGIEPNIAQFCPALKPHQSALSAWGIRGGNRAIFADFGLGKTLIQLQIVTSIIDQLGEPDAKALIVCPLGVKGEFLRDAAAFFNLTLTYVRTDAELAESSETFFITNYERIREGQLDPNNFAVVTLDEASILRSFGSKTYQTFLELFDEVRFKYVCTATPSPNRFKELIHYAGFLGVMDTGQALTRWFKRDSEEAGNLTLHPHKEREFWLWVSTWATFLTKPSDLGFSDEGYELPGLQVIEHRLPVSHEDAGHDSRGQAKLLKDSAIDLRTAAKSKRESLHDRVARAKQIIDGGPSDAHYIIWHDLEDERLAIEEAFADPSYDLRSVYGKQDLEEREQTIADFADGKFRILASKPILTGSGCNFQRHCHRAIYLGIGHKFNDFIQSVHRLFRFLQQFPVYVHLIYTELEDPILANLMRKWQQHKELRATMAAIIREHGLARGDAITQMRRAIGVTRQERRGELFTAVNNDNVQEAELLPDNSVDLIVTSWPFSNHYEYTTLYNDFGHNVDDAAFFRQMDFLSAQMMRVLKPGRLYCVHAKDRILYGSVSGLGMYSVGPFSDKCVAHLIDHGFIYCGRITVVTDVVRENNQTYRLGWTEQCKDGTKMGVGSPEYILLFRKLPSDTSTAFGDNRVEKSKEDYKRSRWQFDAHAHWRSSGDRFLTPAEIEQMDSEQLRALWHQFNATHVYDFEEHVRVAETLESKGLLPSSFMLLDPKSHSQWCWDDVVRMRTLNCDQARGRVEQHICPLAFDIVDRLIERYSNKGELVLDPFGGLMTVPVRAMLKGRRGYGIELSSTYWADGVGYCRAMEEKVSMPTLFDMEEFTRPAGAA